MGERHHDFVSKLAQEFIAQGIRAEADLSDETVGNKTRKALNEKVPYILVIGDKEMAGDQLNIRDRGEQQTRAISKEEFIKEVEKKIKGRI